MLAKHLALSKLALHFGTMQLDLIHFEIYRRLDCAERILQFFHNITNDKTSKKYMKISNCYFAIQKQFLHV